MKHIMLPVMPGMNMTKIMTPPIVNLMSATSFSYSQN